MRTVSLYQNKSLLIKFSGDDFQESLSIVKDKLFNREYKKEQRAWIAPIEKRTLDILSENHFIFSQEVIQLIEQQRKPEMKEVKIDESKLEGLYPFQKEAVKFLVQNNGNGGVFDEMRLGKTIEVLGYCLLNPEIRPVLVVCPASVKINWQREIKKWCNEEAYIIKGRTVYELPKYPFYIINYDILAEKEEIEGSIKYKLRGWVEVLSKIGIQLLITDECFGYDTLVYTDRGLLKIGYIVENKLNVNVFCTNSNNTIDVMPIIHYHKNERKKRMVKLVHSFGELICTEDHLLWSVTYGKWKKVREIESGEDLSFLSETIYDREKREINSKVLQSFLRFLLFYVKGRNLRKISWGKSRKNRKGMPLLQKKDSRYGETTGKENILLPKLQYEIQNGIYRFEKEDAYAGSLCKSIDKTENEFPDRKRIDKKRAVIQKNERKQSCNESRYSKKISRNEKTKWDIGFIKISSWWKWAVNKAPNIIKRVIRGRLDLRISCKDRNETIYESKHSVKLQTRFGECSKENRDRNRWGRTQFKNNESKGLFENKNFRVSRVESITFLELGCDGKSDENSKYDYVYDIEVKDNHNYFADGILVHNCQAISHSSALRTKALIALKRGNKEKVIKRFIPMSGTPIRNRPSEFFTVLNLLDPVSFPNKFRYLERYCDPYYNGFGMAYNGATNIEELHERIKHLMVRRTKEEVLPDLPKKRRIIVPMELDEVEENNYRNADKEFIDWLKEHIKNGLEAQENLEKLRQLAYLAKRNSVIEWIQDYVESGNKLVVGLWHTNAIKDLYEKFKDIAVKIDGSITGDDRQKSVDTFQNDEKCRLILCQIMVVPGLTLHAASATCTVEFSQTSADSEQFEDRVININKKMDSIEAFYLVGSGTVEDDIMSMIDSKKNVVSKVVDGKESEKMFSENFNEGLLKKYKERII